MRSKAMQTTENNLRKKPVTPDPKKEKARDPLERAVEDALIDQDIPVETGVRPTGVK